MPYSCTPAAKETKVVGQCRYFSRSVAETHTKIVHGEHNAGSVLAVLASRHIGCSSCAGVATGVRGSDLGVLIRVLCNVRDELLCGQREQPFAVVNGQSTSTHRSRYVTRYEHSLVFAVEACGVEVVVCDGIRNLARASQYCRRGLSF